MGFALWLDEELAWAAGTYEYRALGVAVIASTQLFRERDFNRRARLPRDAAATYVGQFASIGHLNEYLLRHRPTRRRLARAP